MDGSPPTTRLGWTLERVQDILNGRKQRLDEDAHRLAKAVAVAFHEPNTIDDRLGPPPPRPEGFNEGQWW